jgi:hypothetical protein
MENNLTITSQAIDAACRLHLELRDNGYGADTIESFTQLFEEFCAIFEAFPEHSIQDSIDFWNFHQSEYGELRLTVPPWAVRPLC